MNRFFWVGLLFYCTSALSQLSNMIVFGDSLSDGGNFPESAQLWWHPNQKKDLQNTIAQVYVPFSNPVDTQNNPSLYPVLHDKYLATQTLLNSQERKYRSISWPQFFLKFVAEKKLIASDIISPSNLLNTRKLPSTLSFNYAWGYALSSRGCANPKYKIISHCDANSIFQMRKSYEENPIKLNYLKIEVPGLVEQIHLFLSDYRAGKISINKNTLYTFWSGGNDLIVAGNALRFDANPLPTLQFMCGNTVRHVLKSITLLIQQLPVKQRPKKIYVFNLFNPELTPGFYHYKIAILGNFLVRCYNFWLMVDAKFYNLFSDTKIIVVPTYQLYAKSADNKAFQAHLGQACQITGGNYEDATSIPASNCAGFMFWNAVHPAMPMNVLEAKLLYNYLQSCIQRT